MYQLKIPQSNPSSAPLSRGQSISDDMMETDIEGIGRFDEKIQERLAAHITAYDAIITTASLILPFSVSLASTKASAESFHSQMTMYIFHIMISICIGAALHCILIFSFIKYGAYRYFKFSDYAAKFIEASFVYRQDARKSFGVCTIFFVSSLCVLYFDGLPVQLAIMSTSILAATIVVVAMSLNTMMNTFSLDQYVKRNSNKLMTKLH